MEAGGQVSVVEPILVGKLPATLTLAPRCRCRRKVFRDTAFALAFTLGARGPAPGPRSGREFSCGPRGADSKRSKASKIYRLVTLNTA
jgi:hypothetical protein